MPLQNDTILSIEDGGRRHWRHHTVTTALLEVAKINPTCPALRGPLSLVEGTYRELSYGDLILSAKLVSKEMVTLFGRGNVEALRGKAIAILLPRDVDYVVAMLACFFCRAIYVPLSESLPAPRIAYILQDSGTVGIISSAGDEKINEVTVAALSILGDKIPPLITIERIDGLVWSSGPTPRNEKFFDGTFETSIPKADDVAYMIYTSGTTGKPKGVEIMHKSMLNVMMSHVESKTVSKEDMERSVCVASFIFDSHVREVWMPLVWGGTTCISKDVLSMTEGTMCAGTPTGLVAAATSGIFPSTIQTVMAGGERLTKTVISALGSNNVKEVINAYGPTETVIESLVWKISVNEESIPESGVPIGLPILNNVAYGIKVASSQTERDSGALEHLSNSDNCGLALAKRGEVCELYVGGAGVAKGYRNRESLNKDRFLPDPFRGDGNRMYQTGDLVVFGEKPGDPITYVGRIDTQVKIRGKRLELDEIKSFICLSEDVKDAQVAVKKYQGKDQLVAYIVWKKTSHHEEDAIESFHNLDFMRELKSPNRHTMPVGGHSRQASQSKRKFSLFPMRRRTLAFGLKNNEDENKNGLNPSPTLEQKLMMLSGEKSSTMRSRRRQSQRLTFNTVVDKQAVVTPISVLEQRMMKELGTLEDYKQPSAIVSFPLIIDGKEYDDFPVTVGGKVDIRKLPSPESAAKTAQSQNASTTKHQPSNDSSKVNLNDADDAVRAIVAAVRSILGNDNFCSTDDMFKCGMTSMDVPSLKFILKQELALDYELSSDSIFENPTAEELAAHILNPGTDHDFEKLSSSGDEFIRDECVQGKALPSFIVWFLSTVLTFLSYATSICAVIFATVICVEVLHEYGKCNGTPIEYDLQNDCDNPLKWRAYWAVAIFVPIIIPVCVCVGLVFVALMKWLVIGRYKPGCYAVDSIYYFRWLYVHHLEVFAIRWLLPVLPMRCSFIYNVWLRLMGAKVGWNTIIDSLDLHEMCLLTFGEKVTVQNDAMVTGHVFVKVRVRGRGSDIEAGAGSQKLEGFSQALLLGQCWIRDGSVLGPYSMVQPTLPRPNRRNSVDTWTIVDGIIPAYQSTSRLGQTLHMNRDHQDSLVHTPSIPILGQLQGIITVILMQAIAMDMVLAVMYGLFVPKEAKYATWIGRCFLFFSPWPMGIPYAFLVVIYKRVFIGKFQDGEMSSPSLDKQRWILRSLCTTRIHQAFELAGASSEILNTFYRAMGMTIGWNSQIMPLNIVEYDLFSVGDNVAFGGQVMVCCRTSGGFQKRCSIGNYSAITNSAGMLAGSSIGNNCLVGNLTLLPPEFNVPDNHKCVGTKYSRGFLLDPIIFSNVEGNKTESSRLRSNLIGCCHLISAFLLDLVYLPEFCVIAQLFTSLQIINDAKQEQMHLVHNPWKVGGGYLLVVASIISATLVSSLTIITIKKLTPKFLGQHKRDSPLFVWFIWMTKHQMTMESFSFLLNGTPLQSLNYKLLGASVSLSSRLFMRFFADLDGLVIGQQSILSYDCYLEQHEKTSVVLQFGPITILKEAIIGQRSIILKDATIANGGQIFPLSAIAPGETLNEEEVRGGILAEQYFVRSASEAMATAARGISDDHYSKYSYPIRRLKYQSTDVDREVDIVVIGAGVSGLVATYEFKRKGLSVLMLEKSDEIMGCWRTFANPTSHVAVTEATYRLSGTVEDSYACDYPSRAQVLSKGKEFFEKNDLGQVTEFSAEVMQIEDIPSKSAKNFGSCRVSYQKNGDVTKIGCKGIFIAVGAQAIRNHIDFDGESRFKGSIFYGSNDFEDARTTFQGKRVCIVGCGAFAMENLKTALVHGAKHVTIIHRSDFQVWPRCAHYLLSTSKDVSFGKYNKVYQTIASWSGLKVGVGPNYDVSPFMHPGTTAQPTANDAFFVFHKLGLVTLVHGNIKSINHTSVTYESIPDKSIFETECDVFLKCVGWKDPGIIVKKIFPGFKSRNFIFLNESPRIVFVSDPKYRHDHEVGKGDYSDILKTIPIGGTYSVPNLARIGATLQMYCLANPPTIFDSVLESIPSTDHPLCSWSEAKFQYPKAREISEVIRHVIEDSKGLVSQKHPTFNEFLTMNCHLLTRDLQNRVMNSSSQDYVGYCESSISNIVDEFKNVILECGVECFKNNGADSEDRSESSEGKFLQLVYREETEQPC